MQNYNLNILEKENKFLNKMLEFYIYILLLLHSLYSKTYFLTRFCSQVRNINSIPNYFKLTIKFCIQNKISVGLGSYFLHS